MNVLEAINTRYGGSNASNNNSNNNNSNSSINSNTTTVVTGEPHWQRLHYWVTACSDASSTCASQFSPDVGTHAQQLLQQSLRRAGNVVRYQEWCMNDKNNSNNSINADELNNWLITQSEENHNARQVLFGRWQSTPMQQQQQQQQYLQASPSSSSALAKDALRQAGWAVAHYCVQIGDLHEAWHVLLRLQRDACTTRVQNMQVSLALLHVAIAIHNWSLVREYVLKLQHSIPTPANNNINNAASQQQQQQQQASVENVEAWKTVQAAAGLERLVAGDGPAAMQYFCAVAKYNANNSNNTTTTPVLAASSENITANNYKTFVSSTFSSTAAIAVLNARWVAPEEVSWYAALLTLAYGTRHQLVQLAQDYCALELVPAWRDLLQLVVRSQYKQAWQHLTQVQVPLLVQNSSGQSYTKPTTTTTIMQTSVCAVNVATDLFVAPRWKDMLEPQIRRQFLQAYWMPYQQIALSTMAQELGPDLVPSIPVLYNTLLQELQKQASSSTSGKIHPAWQNTRLALLENSSNNHDENEPAYMLTRTVPTSIEDETDCHEKLNQVAHTLLEDSYTLLFKLACLDANIYLRPDGSMKSGSNPNANRSNRGGGSNSNNAAWGNNASSNQWGTSMETSEVGPGSMLINNNDVDAFIDEAGDENNNDDDDYVDEDDLSENYEDLDDMDRMPEEIQANPEDLY